MAGGIVVSFRPAPAVFNGVPTGKFPGISQRWLQPDQLTFDANAVIATQTFGGQQTFLVPFTLAVGATFDAWGFMPGAGALSLATGIRCGYWKSNPLTGEPAQASPDLEFPIAAAYVASVWKTVALAADLVLVAGRYWLGVGLDGTGGQSAEMESFKEWTPNLQSIGAADGRLINSGVSIRNNAQGVLTNAYVAPFARNGGGPIVCLRVK